jgi:hypothetical protein
MSGQRGRPFEAGNKMGRGRPQGSRNKKSPAGGRILAEYGDSLERKCIWKALQGDMSAMRLCLERLVPPLREPSVRLKTRTACRSPLRQRFWRNRFPRRYCCSGY